MKHPMRALIAFMASCAVACAAAPTVSAEEVLTASSDQITPSGKQLVVSKGASLHAVEWQQHDIPVCWIDPAPDDAAARETVRAAVHETWEVAANVRLTGWASCDVRGGPSRMVRILVSDAEWPRAMVGTTALSRRAPTVFLNFHIARRPSFAGCAGKEDRCLRFSAVHEFGHVLGLIHEQDRPETPAQCIAGLAPGQRQTHSASDLDLLTGYDPDSLMNYCSARGYDPQQPLTLSNEDAVSIRKLFGEPVAAAPGNPAAGTAAPAAAPGAGTAPSGPATTPPPDKSHTKPQHPLFDPN